MAFTAVKTTKKKSCSSVLKTACGLVTYSTIYRHIQISKSVKEVGVRGEGSAVFGLRMLALCSHFKIPRWYLV